MDLSPKILQELPYDGHLILYHQVSSQLYALNETGQLIWKFYKKGLDKESIANKLVSEFFIPYDLALNDVEKCLSSWKHADFFETSYQSDDYPHQFSSKAAIVSTPAQSELTSWYSSHYFSLTGRTIKVSFGDPELEVILLPVLNHLKVEGQNRAYKSYKIWHEGGSYFVVIGNDKAHSTKSLFEAIGWILFDLADQTYRNRDCMAVLHGGAVAKDDYALIISGSKGSGKSTLIAALQHDGFEFLCDDVCPLDKQGQLLPLPMSQRLKAGSWTVLEHLYPSIAQLPIHTALDCQVKYLPPITGGPASWNRAWPVEGLIFPVFQQGVSAELTRLSPLEALKFLVNSSRHGSGCIRSLLKWLENNKCFIIKYSNLSEARDYISTITNQMVQG